MRNPKNILPVLVALTVLFFATMFLTKRHTVNPGASVGYIEVTSKPFLCI